LPRTSEGNNYLNLLNLLSGTRLALILGESSLPR
jgi:hypothetical protein